MRSILPGKIRHVVFPQNNKNKNQGLDVRLRNNPNEVTIVP